MPNIVEYNKNFKLISRIWKICQTKKYLLLILSEYCFYYLLLNLLVMFLKIRFFHYYTLSQLKLIISPFEGKIQI